MSERAEPISQDDEFIGEEVAVSDADDGFAGEHGERLEQGRREPDPAGPI